MVDPLDLTVRVVFFVLVGYAAVEYVRHRDASRRDILLLLATLTTQPAVLTLQDLTGGLAFLDTATIAVITLFPFLFIRLGQHVDPISKRLMLGIAAWTVATLVGAVVYSPVFPDPFLVFFTTYFLVVTFYGTARFVRGTVRTRGALQMRYFVLALGGGLIGAIVLVAVVLGVIGFPQTTIQNVTNLLALCAAVPLSLAFVPPAVVRRQWQIRSVYEFLKVIRSRPDSVVSDHANLLVRSAVEASGALCGLVTIRGEADHEDVVGWHRSPIAADVEAPDRLPSSAIPDGPTVVDADELRGPIWALAQTVGSPSVLVVPVRSGGDTHGNLVLLDHGRSLFPDETLDTLSMMTQEFGVEIERINRLDRQRQLLERLEQSNEELERFAHTVSHDLKNPLTAVQGNLELALDHVEGETRKRLEGAYDGAERMETLIDGILEYARLDTRAGKPEAVDVGEILDAVRSDLQSRIDETDGTIHVDEMPTVLGEPTQVYELFLNLVGNALKFHGDEPPVVEIRVEAEGNVWRFEVEDNGMGIPADEIDGLFEIFQRGSESQDTEGTGLGLALCKKIVERHDGTISIESEPGKGSTFTFTLPRVSTGDGDETSTA